MKTSEHKITPDAVRELVIARVTETQPDVRSPYSIVGNPQMWVIARKQDGTSLAVRPAKAQERRANGSIEEVDGASYQYLGADGEWVSQGMTGAWKYLAKEIEDILKQGGELVLGSEQEPSEAPEL